MIGLFFRLWSPFFNLHRFWPVPFLNWPKEAGVFFPRCGAAVAGTNIHAFHGVPQAVGSMVQSE